MTGLPRGLPRTTAIRTGRPTKYFSLASDEAIIRKRIERNHNHSFSDFVQQLGGRTPEIASVALRVHCHHNSQLWRDATVFHRQFEWFALIGAPMDVAAIIAAIALAYLLHDRKPTFWLAVAGAICLAAGLAAWFGLVAPANAVLATWKPGPIPPDFDIIRTRWETGHMAVAALKLGGFVLLSLAACSQSSGKVRSAPPPMTTCIREARHSGLGKTAPYGSSSVSQ